MQHSSEVIWLASYPKTGGTWMRFLLINYLLNKQSTSLEIQTLFPDIHSISVEDIVSIPRFAQKDRKQMLLKTHFELTPEIPFFAETKQIIYLIRNPLDIISSSLNFYLLHALRTVDSSNSELLNTLQKDFVERFIECGGYEHWVTDGFGTIQSNSESWVDNSFGIPSIWIRYEDLLHDTAGQMERLCQFLGWSLDPDRIPDAVERSSFKSMKMLEEEEISKQQQGGVFYYPPYEAAYRAGKRFMNKGQQGVGKATLNSKQLERASQIFQPVLKRFGYC